MDTALWGFLGSIIGGVISMTITAINFHFQHSKETEIWQRQRAQEAEDRRLELLQQKETLKYEILKNCVHFLTLHKDETDHWDKEGIRPPIYNYLPEAVRWITQFNILFIFNNEELSSSIRFFLDEPTSPFFVENLHRILINPNILEMIRFNAEFHIPDIYYRQ